MKRKILVIIFTFFYLFFACCEETKSTEFHKEEFPSWALDIRRTEIITFGSLPFVTLATTFGYSFYRYYENDFSSEYVPNPLAKTSESANLNTNEQKMIVGSAVLISLGLGLSDLFYNLYKRHSAEKKIRSDAVSNAISITPNEDEEMQGDNSRNRRSAYLYGGVKSVIF